MPQKGKGSEAGDQMTRGRRQQGSGGWVGGATLMQASGAECQGAAMWQGVKNLGGQA